MKAVTVKRVVFPLLLAISCHLAYRIYERSHAFTSDLIWQLLIVGVSLVASIAAWFTTRESRQAKPLPPEDKSL